MQSTFQVTFIGRPNVGKSTLFNAFIGKNIALVQNIAGVTVDRKEFYSQFYDMNLKLVDTGGFTNDNHTINKEIWKQALHSINNSNCILWVIDASTPLSLLDMEIAKLLRNINIPIIICANKIDKKSSKDYQYDILELGYSNLVYISAIEKNGLYDIYEKIKPLYDAHTSNNQLNIENENTNNEFDISLAIVGKPNVGKSTLMNNILQEDRVIISDIAGTTRDSVSEYINFNQHKIKIIDTAGLRRKTNIVSKLESLSSYETIRTIQFANIVALMISAVDGISKQDLKIIKYILKERRALIIIVNKLDLVPNSQLVYDNIIEDISSSINQIKGLKILTTSAIKDKKIKNKLMKEVVNSYQLFNISISTAQLNKWLENTLAKNPPPLSASKRPLKFKHIKQIKNRPPCFAIWVNYINDIPMSYTRYLYKELYSYFELHGITFSIVYKKSSNPYAQN